MNTLEVILNQENSEKVAELSVLTGRTPNELVNDAFARFVDDSRQDETRKFTAWQDAARRVAGIWQDRDDLPDFAELRQTWERHLWEKE